MPSNVERHMKSSSGGARWGWGCQAAGFAPRFFTSASWLGSRRWMPSETCKYSLPSLAVAS